MEVVKPVDPIAAARKDNNGDEDVITLDPLKKNLPNLTKLKIAAIDANTVLREGIKATAEKCGLNAATVRKYLDARVADKVPEHRRNIEQLSIVFEEMEAPEAEAAQATN